MAVVTLAEGSRQPHVYKGLSGDAKPTPASASFGGQWPAYFYETDTKDQFIYDGNGWVRFVHNGSLMVTDPFLDISDGKVDGHTGVNKFGQALDVDSGVVTDVWDGADGTTSTDEWIPPTAARTHDITSTDAADDTGGTGAITVEISGLDASWNEQSETITLNGTANVPTASTYIRIFRMQCVTWGSGKENAGILTATAQTDGTVTAAVQIGNNQTLMAIYTVPAGKKLNMTQYYFGFLGSTPSTTTGNIRLFVSTDASVANAGFQLKHILPAKGGNPDYTHEFKPYFPIGEKKDIKIQMNDCNSASAVLSAGFDGILVDA